MNPLPEMTMPDAILLEIRKTRDELAETYQYNMHELCEALRQEQSLGDHCLGRLNPLREATAQEANHTPEPCELKPIP